jgi:hypothetical protein
MQLIDSIKLLSETIDLAYGRGQYAGAFGLLKAADKIFVELKQRASHDNDLITKIDRLSFLYGNIRQVCPPPGRYATLLANDGQKKRKDVHR